MRETTYIKELSLMLKASADEKDALWAAKYLKNQFEFFGIKAPARNAAFKEFFAKNGLPPEEQLEAMIDELFFLPEREFQYFGIELAAKFKREWKPESVYLFEKMAITKSWWDSVDYINIACIKPYFEKFTDDKASITQRWADSGNTWLQRLSLICQLGKKTRIDIPLLFRNILQLNHSDEFFIQKAIGWALRDLAWKEPDTVRKFVSENKLKPLSRREALKNLRPK